MYIYIAAVMLALVALMVISAYRMKPHVTESTTSVNADAEDDAQSDDIEIAAADAFAEESDGERSE